MAPFQSIAMQRALAEAEQAGARGEVPVGAVVTGADGDVLAADGNRTLELSDPTAHAEMLVIRAAAARLGAQIEYVHETDPRGTIGAPACVMNASRSFGKQKPP